eukprot:TRINITY_DN31540_c0_g2_i2.p1 TRINITY_DN31540_c0_g2~~TRINITY_DN31540_c0_g2_i2.p1  ORF type:complete len:385 (+),score=51.02 TRINITY_DN31540_c0_g2_i2:103-1257(+)
MVEDPLAYPLVLGSPDAGGDDECCVCYAGTADKTRCKHPLCKYCLPLLPRPECPLCRQELQPGALARHATQLAARMAAAAAPVSNAPSHPPQTSLRARLRSRRLAPPRPPPLPSHVNNPGAAAAAAYAAVFAAAVAESAAASSSTAAASASSSRTGYGRPSQRRGASLSPFQEWARRRDGASSSTSPASPRRRDEEAPAPPPAAELLSNRPPSSSHRRSNSEPPAAMSPRGGAVPTSPLASSGRAIISTPRRMEAQGDSHSSALDGSAAVPQGAGQQQQRGLRIAELVTRIGRMSIAEAPRFVSHIGWLEEQGLVEAGRGAAFTLQQTLRRRLTELISAAALASLVALGDAAAALDARHGAAPAEPLRRAFEARLTYSLLRLSA